MAARSCNYAGDSVLAAFGAESAREDDAERAVLAGLDLLAEARLQAERIERTHRQGGFQVRVGIHTGHVLLGGGVDDEGTIRGFTVNIAARLEQTAPPGSLRISQETWRHVRGVFDFEAQPPLQVKGQDEPLRTWLVLRAKPRAFRVATRGIEGTETPLVGRDAELAQLVAAFEATLQTRKLQALTLLAEAGLGKSRLIQELQQRLEGYSQPCWLLLGRALPSGTPAALRTAARRARLAAADRRQRQRRGRRAAVSSKGWRRISANKANCRRSCSASSWAWTSRPARGSPACSRSRASCATAPSPRSTATCRPCATRRIRRWS